MIRILVGSLNFAQGFFSAKRHIAELQKFEGRQYYRNNCQWKRLEHI